MGTNFREPSGPGQAAQAVRAAKTTQGSRPTNTDPSVMGGARDYGNYQPASPTQSGYTAGGGTPVSGNADDSFIRQLQAALGNMGSGASGASNADVSSAAMAQTAGMYDPKIAALKNAIRQAGTNAQAATKGTQAVYNDYQNFLNTDTAPAIQQNNVSSKAAAANTANSLKQAITQDYTNRLKDQVNMYKQLGIQAAGGTALQDQQSNEQTSLDNAAAMGSTEQSALNVEHQGDVGYLNASKAIGKNESANAVSAIQQKLQQYQNTTNTDIAGLEGAKQAAFAQAVAKMQGQQASASQSSQNSLWSKMMDIARLKQAAQKSGSGGGGASNAPTSGLSGAVAQLGDQNYANDFQSILQEASTWKNSPDAVSIYGHRPSSPDELAKVILDGAKNRNLPPAEQMKLWQAALKYYGKG